MQPSTNSLLITANLMAERIAYHAQFMGLDDEDEKILWRYFATRKHESSPSVIACLKKHAEHQAIEVRRVEANVTLSPDWAKPSGVIFKAQRKLEAVLLIYGEAGDCIDFCTEQDIRERAEAEARTEAFKMWYDQIAPREVDGKMISPSSDDVGVILRMETTDLKKMLEAI